MLADAKDASELMVDLAYAALYFDDDGMAEAVLDLEEDMSDLVHEMRSMAMLAVRHPRLDRQYSLLRTGNGDARMPRRIAIAIAGRAGRTCFGQAPGGICPSANRPCAK